MRGHKKVVPDFRHVKNSHYDREIFPPFKLQHFFTHNISKNRYMKYNHLTHYQMTNFRLFQTERVCRRQFQWQKVIQTGREHCGKRRNCSLQAISPFPTVFSTGLFFRGVKRCHCVGMG